MVPNGWRIITLGEVVTHKKGFAFKSSSYTSSGTRLIRISDTTRNSVHDNSPVYISHEEAEVLSEHKLSTSDIILSTVGSRPHLLDSMVGKAIQIPSKDNGSLLNQNLVKLIPKKDRITNQYLFAMLKIKKFNHFISTLIRGNANQVSITLKELFEYSFLLPPLLEQQKIAKILTTWDKAINTTERLIDNSKQQKKALMQQLLTGKKRLLDDNGKPFEGEWEEEKLGDLYSFKRGKGISKGQLTDSGNKCVLYGELYTYYGEVINEVKSRTLETNSVKSKKYDVLIPASTTTTGIDLANATAILEDDILLGGDINILRPKKSINSIFMAHLLTHFKKHEIARKAQGITIIHVYGKDLANIAVQLPDSLEEQQKIATVLTTADKEIELLEQQLADLQQEKKALMQVLLTGKVRVRVD